ncbi:MAG: type II CRISPR RNA-guided endonuclease Cas9, partial [Saezia sp.]
TPAEKTVRARYREERKATDDGKSKIEKSYDLYIDRAMIEQEFDTLWAKQVVFNPKLFNAKAHDDLKDCLLHQRRLRPVKPGRCTLLPDEERAPLALPSAQRFRMYQEVNNLRIVHEGLQDRPLTLQERDLVISELEENSKRSFDQLRRLLKLQGNSKFNLEDDKRNDLKGNATGAHLAKKDLFGKAWHAISPEQQDIIVLQILNEESESNLVDWLQKHAHIDEAVADKIANTSLPDGYSSLSQKAIARILPELQKTVMTYSDAALAAGFDHHSDSKANTKIEGLTSEYEVINPGTGEIKTYHIFKQLPYYGEYLQRHVGFGTGVVEDSPEKRYGRIANPTVHIGLNQIRTVVNAIIARYGHPTQVVVEVARELKQSKKEKER